MRVERQLWLIARGNAIAGCQVGAIGLERATQNLEPGVTEIHVQPVLDTPEVHALSDSSQGWIDDLELVTNDERLPALLVEQGATLIGYRALRDAMRAA